MIHVSAAQFAPDRNLRTALAKSPYFSTMATLPFSGILACDGWKQTSDTKTF
jgi:hypothetical protein